jgi:pyruvate formate lyase activating enzyme
MIKGFLGTSLIDFPSQIAAVVFTGGCNFACPFCQNAALVLPEKLQFQPDIPEEEVLQKIAARSNFINGVVISGGEPALHGERLIEFIKNIKKINSCKKSPLVKLDTNGAFPEVLQLLIEEGLIDFVAMDIKSVPKKYDEVSKVKQSFDHVRKSIDILNQSSIPYEFRTTLVPTLIAMEDLLEIGQLIKDCKSFVVQAFRPKGLIDPSYENIDPYPAKFYLEVVEKMNATFQFQTIARF